MDEPLDLARHDFEQIPGKSVRLNGVAYEVGEYVGMGGVKFVFKLINKRSGLCHHLIKIFKVIDPAALDLQRSEIEAFKQLKKVGIPTPHTLHFESNGGAFQVQDFIGPYAIVESDVEDQIRKATEILAKDPNRAIGMLQSALQQNQYHTVALNNLAAAYRQLGEDGKALDCQQKVVTIEPHYCDYRYFLISLYAGIGALASARQAYEKLIELFPYPHQIDALLIEILLISGLPAEADTILRAARFEDDEKEKKQVLEQRVKSALNAQENAHKLFNSAHNLVSQGKLAEAYPILDKAYHIYPEDYELSINYGLSLRAVGQFEKAKKLLLQRLGIVRETNLYLTCLANGAYCDLLAGKVGDALPLLSHLEAC